MTLLVIAPPLAFGIWHLAFGIWQFAGVIVGLLVLSVAARALGGSGPALTLVALALGPEWNGRQRQHSERERGCMHYFPAHFYNSTIFLKSVLGSKW